MKKGAKEKKVMVVRTLSFYNGFFGDSSSFGRKKAVGWKRSFGANVFKNRVRYICVVQKRQKFKEWLALDNFSPSSLELVKE